MTSSEIRQAFLLFFKSKGHTIVPSAPIVIKNDPTLLFTNAGMNQFKDYFLGNKHPEYKRVADTQKCLRVSGKHNDLEEVGVDTYHHTMFEMLGNWSFGDYFKKEAIAWSWELLTEVYKLDKERLYVTIFEGDKKEGLAKDEEAFAEWKKYVPEDRILLGNKKDNFWEMGDTGPCGPSSEIHFDSRSEEERKAVSGAALVNRDNPQVIEIWNNVFMEFNRIWDTNKGGASELRAWEERHEYLLLSTDKQKHEDFKIGRADKHRELTLLIPLPAKNVDTGMGFERLVRVIQGVKSNYNTDVFSGTINEIEKITGKQYYGGDSKQAIAFRVLADHIRAIGFTIADAQLPSNTGAGYVIRRILRRAVRYYYSYLDYKQPLLFHLMPVIAKQFEEIFPELQQQVDFVVKLVRREEEMFLKTLEYGLRRFNTYMDIAGLDTGVSIHGDEDSFVHLNIKSKYWQYRHNKIIAGEFAFELNDTFGFPIDLTKLIASERGFTVDEVGFEKALKKQKARSRAATALETGDWAILKEVDSEFVGYNASETTTEVAKYRKVKTKSKEYYQIVLESTPFYAESGGQVGDTGELFFEENNQIVRIVDTKKENDLIIHFAENIPDDLIGKVIAKVDTKRRTNITLNHSATHLIHAALRQLLGTHIVQKGSLVTESYLRFDFSHFAKVPDEEIKKIETIVNSKIRENIKIDIRFMSKDEAIELGAMALFGEKYNDEVRVVIMDLDFSKELCGGTHVHSTGEIGFFKIKHETSVAAGVRRIEAVTGKSAEDYVNEQLGELNEAKVQLNNPQQLSKSIENLLNEKIELKSKLESAEARLVNVLIPELLKKQQIVNGIPFIGEVVEITSVEALKKLRVELNKELDGAVVLCSSFGDRVEVPISFSETLVERGFDANKIIKEKIGHLVKGGGRGSKYLASAGGKDGSNFQQVIDIIKGLL